MEPSLLRDRRIELPDGTGCGIPGIGERRFPFFFPLFVQLLELGDIDEHFTADIDLLGDRIDAFDPERDRLDGLDVLGDILTLKPVAPGRRADKHSLPVREFHGKAVIFRFDGIFDLAVRSSAPF